MAKEKKGPDIYVEQRKQGDYAVRQEHSKRASAVEPTQKKQLRRRENCSPARSRM